MVRNPARVVTSSTTLPSRFTIVRTEYNVGSSMDQSLGDATVSVSVATGSFSGSTVTWVLARTTRSPDESISVHSTSTFAGVWSLLYKVTSTGIDHFPSALRTGLANTPSVSI